MRNPVLTSEEESLLISVYESRNSQQHPLNQEEIAAMFGISRKTLYRTLMKHGFTLRYRAPNKHPTKPMSEATRQRLSESLKQRFRLSRSVMEPPAPRRREVLTPLTEAETKRETHLDELIVSLAGLSTDELTYVMANAWLTHGDHLRAAA